MAKSMFPPPRSRLASRKPKPVTNLEVESYPLLADVVNSQRVGIPCSKPTLEEINSNLRDIKELFWPWGEDKYDVRDMNGRTTLHEAAEMGHEAVAEYLVQKGANIYAKDDQGFTPLDLANRFGNRTLTTIMLRNNQVNIREEDYTDSNCKKDGLKWAIAILNVGIELLQAILAQERSYWKINARYYQRLGVALSFLCLMLSVFDMIYEAKRDRVELKKRRGCYWFYYPGRHGGAFGRTMLWFGLLSSILQICLNLASLKIKRAILKFDCTALLLSICYLLARFGCRERTMMGMLKCGDHGGTLIEGRLHHGRWSFDCIHCSPMDHFNNL